MLNDLSVSVDIRALQVVQKTAALAYHLEEPTSAVVILFVRAEMVGQIIDAFGEQRHLNVRRSSVGCVDLILLDRRAFFKSHVLVCPDVAAGMAVFVSFR